MHDDDFELPFAVKRYNLRKDFDMCMEWYKEANELRLFRPIVANWSEEWCWAAQSIGETEMSDAFREIYMGVRWGMDADRLHAMVSAVLPRMDAFIEDYDKTDGAGRPLPRPGCESLQ